VSTALIETQFAEAAADSNAEKITTVDLGQIRNAANANEAFEVILSWGWS
jgi:hypothetical protein